MGLPLPASLGAALDALEAGFSEAEAQAALDGPCHQR